METINILSNSIVKNGVQAIILVNEGTNMFRQEYLLVQDHDDRKRGDGIKRLGLPGGGIDEGETPYQSIMRELNEEVALDLKKNYLEQFGCYQKRRPNGCINDNYLFTSRLNYKPRLITNDPNEVSEVFILSLIEIISLSAKSVIHEGSIRLIVHYLNGVRSGSLNEPAILNGLIKF